MNKSLLLLLSNLWGHISKKRHKQFYLLILLTILCSFAEIVSLGAVIPFIGAITQPEQLMDISIINNAAVYLNITSGKELVYPLAIAFGSAAVMAGILRISLVWATIQFGNGCGADLSINLYKKTLYQEYPVHISTSTSEIISSITQKVAAVTGILTAVTSLITSIFLFVSIISTLIIVNPFLAISAASVFGLAYLLIAISTKSRLQVNSSLIADQQNQVVKSLQEGLGSIRDVLLDGSQKVFIAAYSKAVNNVRVGFVQNTFINQFPRFAMESLGLLLIAIFVIYIYKTGSGLESSLSLLAFIGLGAQRLLPIVQQIYANWSVLQGNQFALVDVLNLLNQKMPDSLNKRSIKKTRFKEKIILESVSFKYQDTDTYVLKDVNLEIPKGSKVGIIGETGSGKSTLIDILLGLLKPSEGEIKIDSKKIYSKDEISSWQANLAHVPQSIYLSDSTIAENIAFGLDKNSINHTLVQECARKAQIEDFILNRNGGYESIVGERGIKLSGGQKQRLGIARALYKQASVIIFDEATSALDDKTEEEVMKTIDELSDDLTLIMVAHRLTTLKNCSFIVELKDNKIYKISTYENLMKDLNNLSK